MTFCFWLFSCRGRTHNVVATAVCATERCTHTPTCCTHIFLRTARSLRTSHTLMHVNTHAWLKSQVLVACACHISLSSHLLPSHVSPVLAPAVPWRSLRDHSRLRPRRPHWRSCPHDLAELSRPESAGQADSARGRAGWLSGQVVTNTGYEPKRVRQDHFRGQWHDAHQRSGPQFLRLLENHKREHETIRCFHSVWILFFARFSLVILFLWKKAKKACNRETVARKREKETKEKVLWSVLQSRCQGKVDGTVWFSEESKNSVLKSLERRAQQAILGENCSETIMLDWVRHWDPKFGSKKFRISIIRVTARAWISKTAVIGNIFNGQIKLSVREHICVANCRWRVVFTRIATQEVAKKLKNWKHAAIKSKILKAMKIGRISCAAWSGITYNESIEGSSTKRTRNIGFWWRFENLPWSWLIEQLWQYHVPHQALITSSSRKLNSEVRMLRNTREDMRIRGNVFDCQRARWDPDELYNDSRTLATLMGILVTEGMEKSESEEPLQSTPVSYFQIESKTKI